MLKITNVKVVKISERNRLKAVASITIEDCFVVNDIKLLEGEKGLYISMPSRKTINGDFKDVAHPINAETRNLIQESIINQYTQM